MIVLKDFHLFLMMIILLYTYIHEYLFVVNHIYSTAVATTAAASPLLYTSIYVLMNRFLVCTNKSQNKQKDKYQLLLFQCDEICRCSLLHNYPQ